MKFSIDVEFRPDGRFEATCPEMGFSATGSSIEDVFNQVRNLLMYHISNSEETGISPIQEDVVRQVTLVFKNKNFYLPRNPKVH